jgi:hypothetical protein
MNEHLTKAIVDIAIFLEFTNEEYLNPDIAVEAMEQLAAQLQEMPEGDQRDLAKRIIGLSASYEQQHREFVADLPEALGLL